MQAANETYITAKRPTFRRETPSSPDLIEIGIIGCTPGWSHVAEIYGPRHPKLCNA